MGVSGHGQGIKVGGLFLFFVVAFLRALPAGVGFLVPLPSVGTTEGRMVVSTDDVALPPTIADNATDCTTVFASSHFLGMGGSVFKWWCGEGCKGGRSFNSHQNWALRWL